MKSFFAAIAALVITVGMASAATITPTSIDWTNNGTVTDPVRTDPTKAYDGDVGTFWSIGLGGTAVVNFAQDISDFFAIEITNGNRLTYDESYKVEAWVGGVWEFVGSATNDIALTTFMLAGPTNKIRLTDTSLVVAGRDGTDIAEMYAAPIPVPAALPLLLGAFALLGVIGWRKKAA